MIVPAERAEEARAVLVELFPGGFEECEVDAGVELAAYAEGDEEAKLRAVFGSVQADDVEPGWEERWRDFHRGVRIGELWVGPPWEKPPTGVAAIVIDPGQAFGTGSHATTRLCLELLAGLPRGSLLDVGCGSGVLAIAAARLGFSPVLAVDVDPLAVAASVENARVNGVEVDVAECDALTGDLPGTDVVVANLTRAAVTALVPRLRATWIVTSGYLAADRLDLAAFERAGRSELDGWAADVWRPAAKLGCADDDVLHQLPGLQGVPRRRARRARTAARRRP